MKKILNLLLAAVLAVSLGLMLRQFLSDRAADDSYAQALALAQGGSAATFATEAPPEPGETVWVPATVEDDPVLEELAALDLEALRQVNADVVGWIRIPDTKIDYPIVQGQDNEYYLEHTWDGQARAAGSIFLECQCDPSFTQFNTIVYGHNMRSGAMFAELRSYTTQDYFQAHPYVYIRTDAGVWRYEIFASYKAPLDSYAYGLSFHQDRTREYFLHQAWYETVIETGITPAITDRILTLSTCSAAGYSTRWVVQARLPMVALEAEALP